MFQHRHNNNTGFEGDMKTDAAMLTVNTSKASLVCREHNYYTTVHITFLNPGVGQAKPTLPSDCESDRSV